MSCQPDVPSCVSGFFVPLSTGYLPPGGYSAAWARGVERPAMCWGRGAPRGHGHEDPQARAIGCAAAAAMDTALCYSTH
jgi:hypothetical protein